MSETFITPKCNIVFPKIEKKVSFKGGKEYYSVQVIIDKSEDMRVIKAAISKVSNKKWGIKPSNLDKNPVYDGDTFLTKKGGLKKDAYPFYKNRWVINLKSVIKPRVLGPDKRPLDNGDVTHGSECYVSFHAFAWGSDEKGVSLALHNIQKLSEGNLPENEQTNPEDDFGVVDMPTPESGLDLFEENDLGL